MPDARAVTPTQHREETAQMRRHSRRPDLRVAVSAIRDRLSGQAMNRQAPAILGHRSGCELERAQLVGGDVCERSCLRVRQPTSTFGASVGMSSASASSWVASSAA